MRLEKNIEARGFLLRNWSQGFLEQAVRKTGASLFWTNVSGELRMTIFGTREQLKEVFFFVEIPHVQSHDSYFSTISKYLHGTSVLFVSGKQKVVQMRMDGFDGLKDTIRTIKRQEYEQLVDHLRKVQNFIEKFDDWKVNINVDGSEEEFIKSEYNPNGVGVPSTHLMADKVLLASGSMTNEIYAHFFPKVFRARHRLVYGSNIQRFYQKTPNPIVSKFFFYPQCFTFSFFGSTETW